MVSLPHLIAIPTKSDKDLANHRTPTSHQHYVKSVLTKNVFTCHNAKYRGKEIKKERHFRVHLAMPKSLLDRYCNSVMKGKLRIRSLIIRNAVEEFLDRQEGKKVE